MASTYSPSLRLELMATGDQSGTWGDTTNTNLGTLLEQSITGYLSKAMADTDQTLTNLNGASDEARNMVLNLTGALTAGRNVVVPAANKVYLVRNSTTGNFAVTVKTSAGTGVAVYPGQTRWVACDGTNVADYDVPKFLDSQFLLADDADVTKLVQFNASGLPTGTARTYDFPYYSGTLGLVSDIRGQIYGLTLSNNVTDPTNDIDIAIGNAVDSSSTVSMILSSALGKRLDAAWAVGGTPGATVGGLDTGSITDGTYHIYLIRRPDTGVVDACFSASLVGPVTGGAIPAAYTQYRRIGSIQRVSGAIRLFYQYGDMFTYQTAVTDRSSTSSASGVLLSVSVPFGIQVRPLFFLTASLPTITSVVTLMASGASASSSIPAQVASINGSFGIFTTHFSAVVTNTSAQIYFTTTVTGAISANVLDTYGYIDTRGQ